MISMMTLNLTLDVSFKAFEAQLIFSNRNPYFWPQILKEHEILSMDMYPCKKFRPLLKSEVKNKGPIWKNEIEFQMTLSETSKIKFKVTIGILIENPIDLGGHQFFLGSVDSKIRGEGSRTFLTPCIVIKHDHIIFILQNKKLALFV